MEKKTLIMSNNYLFFMDQSCAMYRTAKLLPQYTLEKLTQLCDNKNFNFVGKAYSEIVFHVMVKLACVYCFICF